MLWTETYKSLTSHAPQQGQRRPVVGLTGNYEEQKCTLNETYYKSVRKAGAVPAIIPPTTTDLEALDHWLDTIDALLLTGGADINPLLIGQQPCAALHGINPERDICELLLCRMAADRQMPILGICKGMQVMAAALGGDVCQDIWTQREGTWVKHSQDAPRNLETHSVDICPDTLLAQLYGGAGSIDVNSFHHQAVSTPPQHFRISATAADGVVEAMEATDQRPMLGVQWHPECLDPQPLFRWLTDEARLYHDTCNLQDQVVSIDTHCDTPMFFDQDINFASLDPRLKMDLWKMRNGRLDSCVMVAYLKQEGRTSADLLAATAHADHLLDQIEDMVGALPEHVGIARTAADVVSLKQQGRRAIILGIENAYAIGADIANVSRFRQRGVVYMTLCHNGDNDLCDSAKGQTEHNGVSRFGADVIAEMNRVGMMVDLSHASEKSFYDALDISTQPIICSHSSARALCNHPRNLTDDQLRALARADGYVGVTFYKGFLNTNPDEATVVDALNHLDHMVRIAGIEHVGIGSDFDGDGGVPGIDDASQMTNFVRHLLRRRYSPSDIRQLVGGNFMRLWNRVGQS